LAFEEARELAEDAEAIASEVVFERGVEYAMRMLKKSSDKQ